MDIGRTDFNSIYSQWYSRFVTIAMRYVRDRSTAEDIVADAIVSFWENRDKVQEADKIPAWIFTVIRNKCLNFLSARKRHLEIFGEINAHELRMTNASIMSLRACEPEKLFARELSEMVKKAMEGMPVLTREVFIASRLEEKTYAEIAARHNISVRRVTTEIQRALAVFRKELAAYMPMLTMLLILNR